MEASNVKAVRFTGTGACGVGRSRIVGISVLAGAGTPRLTITEGVGGTTRIDLDFLQSASHWIEVPGDGVLFSSDPAIGTLTNITAVTIFFV